MISHKVCSLPFSYPQFGAIPGGFGVALASKSQWIWIRRRDTTENASNSEPKTEISAPATHPSSDTPTEWKSRYQSTVGKGIIRVTEDLLGSQIGSQGRISIRQPSKQQLVDFFIAMKPVDDMVIGDTESGQIAEIAESKSISIK